MPNSIVCTSSKEWAQVVVLQFFWFFAHFWQELLDFADELLCGESWENIPLEFYWPTISCVHGSEFW